MKRNRITSHRVERYLRKSNRQTTMVYKTMVGNQEIKNPEKLVYFPCKNIQTAILTMLYEELLSYCMVFNAKET